MQARVDRRSVLTLTGAGALTAVLSACGRPTKPQSTPPSPVMTPPDDILMFIRHAEDPTGPDVPPFGITAEGDRDSVRSLTVRGWTRSGALVGLFDPRTADGAQLPPRPGLARPAAIFAHNPGVHDSKRSFETVTPLAAALNLQVDLRFTQEQTKDLAAVLDTAHGATLVAWRHEQIADIVSSLSRVTPAPPKFWPEDRYDMTYVLTRNGTGWNFMQLPQMLLAGDSAAPIGIT